ncbi:hypothetical protein DRN98_00975, partial [Methanosarcinales archaeon]
MLIRKLKKTLRLSMAELSLKTLAFISKEDVPAIRGYIASYFPNDPLFHNHLKRGLFYSYPRVQYKIVNGVTKIIGISEGVSAVKKISIIEKLNLWNKVISILHKDVLEREVLLGICEKTKFYVFLSPWLALNEKNYEKYQKLGSWAKRKALLEKILIGNIISMSKGLGYTVPGPIEVNILKLR